MTEQDQNGDAGLNEETKRSDFKDEAVKRLAEFAKQVDNLHSPIRARGLSAIILEQVGIPFPESIAALRSEFSTESDRGCAVLAAAYLDQQLGELLRARLVDDKKAMNSLLDDGRALGTFSAKVDLCYMLGEICKNTANLLHLIRKIRNEFAHDVDITFESDSVRSRCASLPADPFGRGRSPRELFITNLFSVLAPIHSARLQAKHLSAAPAFPSVSSDDFRTAFPGVLEQLELADKTKNQ